MEKIIIILCTILIIISIFGMIYISGKNANCEPLLVQAQVQSVFYCPDSFGGFEHWSGIALEENKKVYYMVLEPVEKGDIIYSKRICGYPEKSLYNNWMVSR
jgi:hypothetical protein